MLSSSYTNPVLFLVHPLSGKRQPNSSVHDCFPPPFFLLFFPCFHPMLSRRRARHISASAQAHHSGPHPGPRLQHFEQAPCQPPPIEQQEEVECEASGVGSGIEPRVRRHANPQRWQSSDVDRLHLHRTGRAQGMRVLVQKSNEEWFDVFGGIRGTDIHRCSCMSARPRFILFMFLITHTKIDYFCVTDNSVRASFFPSPFFFFDSSVVV